MCDFVGTEVDFWSGPESRGFGMDHSSQTDGNIGMGGIPILVFPGSYFCQSWILQLTNFYWPSSSDQNQNTQTTARSFSDDAFDLTVIAGGWIIAGQLVIAMSMFCLPTLLERGNRARVIVPSWQEAIAIRRRKVIALTEDKTCCWRYAWPSI